MKGLEVLIAAIDVSKKVARRNTNELASLWGATLQKSARGKNDIVGPHLSMGLPHAGRMNLIAQTLSSITLGTPVTHANLTMIPLLGPPSAEREPSYLTLDQALAVDQRHADENPRALRELPSFEITEVSLQGSVPELRVINRGTKPVFILDGEELVGAKQNRVVNLSILVPAASTLTIPVSCVEAGRWRAKSRVFSSAPRAQYSTGRAKRVAQVTYNLKASGSRHSDQAEVWSDIAAMSAKLEAESPTAAMEEIFTRHAAFTDSVVATLRPVEHQVGALFILDGHVIGLDLFDRAATLRRLLGKLVRSVAVDALASPAEEPPITGNLAGKVAEHFLATVCAASTHEAPGVGVGRDIRLEAQTLTGASLVADEEVIHLSAFHI